MDIVQSQGGALFESDLILSASTGRLQGYQVLDIQGTNEDSDVGTEDLWVVGGVRSVETVADNVDVISANVQDTNGGTGAHRVRIFGLDANWNYQDEIITLNGGTVVSTNTYIRFNGAVALEVGSNQGAQGDIDFEMNGNVQGRIVAGRSNTQLSHYSVAANTYAYILRLFASGSNTAPDARVELHARCLDVDGAGAAGGWALLRGLYVDNQHIAADLLGGLTPLPPKTDIRMQGISTTNNETFSGGYTILLETVDKAEVTGLSMRDGRYQALKGDES